MSSRSNNTVCCGAASPQRTVLWAKTVELSKYYSLSHILAILHGMDIRYISKLSSIFAIQSDM